MNASDCRSCGAAIVWAVTEKGARMPVDVEPVESGNLLLRHVAVGEPPLAHVVTADERAELERQHAFRVRVGMHEPGPFTLYRSHFASCPHAAQHRRRPS